MRICESLFYLAADDRKAHGWILGFLPTKVIARRNKAQFVYGGLAERTVVSQARGGGA